MKSSDLFKTLSLSVLLGLVGSNAASAAVTKTKHHTVVKRTVRHSSKSSTAPYYTALAQEVVTLRNEVNTLKKEHASEDDRLDIHKNYFGGMLVTTSPYIGINVTPVGQELMINLPSVNEDLRLLQQRQKMEVAMRRSGKQLENPLMDLSGKFEAYVGTQKPYSGSNVSDIGLATVDLNAVVLYNDWMTSAMGIGFDEGNILGTQTILPRVNWSNLSIDKAFFTLGNLNRSPLYATVGQLYVPFGSFGSWTSAKSLGSWARTKARAVIVGFAPCTGSGPYGSIYAYRGDSMVFASNYGINNYGANLMYAHQYNQWKSELGASYITSLTDAKGMQTTGGTTFAGFGTSYATEQLAYRVPAADFRAKLGTDYWSISAEYVKALRDFNVANMSYNSLGARPATLHTEASLMFPLMERPAALVLAYGVTDEALALNLPKRRYTASLVVAPVRNTYASLEFRKDHDYSAATTATGAGSAAITGSGAHKTSLSAQFGVNF